MNPQPSYIHEDDNLVFEDEANTILVSCNPTVTEVVVPETVKKINPDAFAGCTELTSVTIGLGTKSVKTITKTLFQNCKALTHVVLGSSITAIGTEAFAHNRCQSITIPASVKRIGNDAFRCKKIDEVHIEDLAAWCNIEFASASANPLANQLFVGDEKITDLVIPEGVKSIRDWSTWCRWPSGLGTRLWFLSTAVRSRALFPNDPRLDYHKLPGCVHNGGEAMDIFPKMKNMSSAEEQQTRKDLLQYCELDTWSMVVILKELYRVSK